jgi:hypothetical protein
MRCSKCEETDRLTGHHKYPVVHFGEKKEGLQIILCVKCHRRIEDVYQAVESFIGNVPFGTRFRLDRSNYDRIVQNFLKNEKIIYLAC